MEYLVSREGYIGREEGGQGGRGRGSWELEGGEREGGEPECAVFLVVDTVIFKFFVLCSSVCICQLQFVVCTSVCLSWSYYFLGILGGGKKEVSLTRKSILHHMFYFFIVNNVGLFYVYPDVMGKLPPQVSNKYQK